MKTSSYIVVLCFEAQNLLAIVMISGIDTQPSHNVLYEAQIYNGRIFERSFSLKEYIEYT